MIVALSAGVLTTGCAPKLGGNDYSTAAVGEVSRTEEGVILAKRVVNFNATEANQPGVGAAAGGVAGFGLGQAAGGGRGSVATGLIGGLAGAFAGHAAEQGLTHQEGYEYQVKLTKTKEVITIAQGAEPSLNVGQPVYVVKSNRGRSRILAR